jgi:hypothetical protein
MLRWSYSDPDEGDSMFLRNVANYVTIHTVLQLGKHHRTVLLPCKPKIRYSSAYLRSLFYRVGSFINHLAELKITHNCWNHLGNTAKFHFYIGDHIWDS